MAFIAGAYTATLVVAGGSPFDIGATREGFRLREVIHVQQVIDDSAGDAPVDGIMQGVEVTITLDYIEYSKIQAALYASHTRGQPKSKVGYVVPALGGPLVLTPVAGTPVIAGDGGSGSDVWTFNWAVVESDIETLLSSKLRQGPVTFRCYPDPTSGVTYARA